MKKILINFELFIAFAVGFLAQTYIIFRDMSGEHLLLNLRGTLGFWGGVVLVSLVFKPMK